MKATKQLSLAAGLVLLATKALSEECCCCGAESKFYFDVDAGVSFLPRIHVLDGGNTIDFNTGVRADLRLGYNLSSWAAVEFETGVIWNSVDKIGGLPMSTFGGSMDVYQIPFMGNLVLSAPEKHGLRPYIGGGMGGATSLLDFQSPLGNISDNDFTFSYQAFAGVTYAISSSVELGLSYRFLQTFDHGWSDGGVSLHTEGTATHSIVASFRWKF